MSKKDQDNDIEFITRLAQVLSDSELAEVRVKREFGDDKTLDVRVTRNFAPASAAINIPAPAAAPLGASPAAPSATPAEAQSTPATPDTSNAVTSPMVGTVYLQAEPGNPPFVSIGDKVSIGQTLLIVEAMKTMNQIPSPKAGTVKRILVDDASPVEFGTPLIVIE